MAIMLSSPAGLTLPVTIIRTLSGNLRSLKRMGFRVEKNWCQGACLPMTVKTKSVLFGSCWRQDLAQALEKLARCHQVSAMALLAGRSAHRHKIHSQP